MSEAREFDVVLMGATGFTGRLVAEHLLARHGADGELKWALAGRNEEKLAKIRDELGDDAGSLPIVVADSHDRESLDALVKRTKVVCTTVGPYALHGSELVAACAEHGVAIELNANPYRLDMDWRFIRSATDRGVLISINPDAHSTDDLHNVRWGVEVARKGWLTPEQCLNARSLHDFSDWLAARRERHPVST